MNRKTFVKSTNDSTEDESGRVRDRQQQQQLGEDVSQIYEDIFAEDEFRQQTHPLRYWSTYPNCHLIECQLKLIFGGLE